MKSLGAALVAGCAALAACSSTTTGAGQAGPSSQPGVPLTSAAASTPAASTVAPVTSGAVSSTGPVIHPAPPTPLRTVTVHAADGRTYVVKIWQQVQDPTCFDHAYGSPVVSFLTQHPCRGLTRFLATTTVAGRPVGFAQSSTSLPGTPTDPYKYAGEFVRLEKQDGTGSIDDLLRDGYRLPSGPTAIPAGEAFNVLSQDNGVSIYDAWYLDGPTPVQDPALIRMTNDIFLQF